jgi:hypothetical protein
MLTFSILHKFFSLNVVISPKTKNTKFGMHQKPRDSNNKKKHPKQRISGGEGSTGAIK